jgi:predicted dehydrogenase
MKKFRIATLGLEPDDAWQRSALAHHPFFDLVEPEAPGLDAIVIASPPASHVEDVLGSLARGRNVIVVPPFALDVEGAQRMADAAKKAGTACGVAYAYRFLPQAAATKELITNGHLGALRSIEIARQTGALRKAALTQRGWWCERGRGGGVAATGLAHSIDLALWFAGRVPANVSGFVRTANPMRRDKDGEFAATADDGAFALLDFGDGLAGRVSDDRTAPVESFVCAAYGETRVAVSSGREIDDTTLYTVDDDETNELQLAPSPHAKSTARLGNVAYIMELYDELIERIENGAGMLPSFDEALAVQRVVSAIGG